MVNIGTELQTVDSSRPEPQNFSAPLLLPGDVILPGKGCCRLPEGGYHIVCKILKVHGNGASRYRHLAEAVDRRLHKNIGKAEHRPLHGGRHARFQYLPHITQAGLRLLTSLHTHGFLSSTSAER